MGTDKLLNFLQSNHSISNELAKEIASQFKSKVIKKNEFHLREGKVCDEYLFLDRGFMRSQVFDLNGNDITTSLYGPSDLIFEVNSFFTRTPSKENIIALEDCEGRYISFDQLNHFFHTFPEFREFGRSILVKGYTSLKLRMITTITEKAENRYIELLSKSPELFLHVPLKYIASYLGINDTSLSRIRKEFSKH